jgi:LmbE family N-acetylglucosaminyl deacetylase
MPDREALLSHRAGVDVHESGAMRATVFMSGRTHVLALALTLAAVPATAQQPAMPAQSRTILAIGAHAGDMELTAGAVLLKQRQLGDRIVLLHLSLGERGNPKLEAAAYARQKRTEAEAAARVLGADVLFGPFRDGEVPNNDDARRHVADVIRRVRPTLVITHWRESIHRDHAATHAIVVDAVLLAAIDGGKAGEPPHRGTRVWYAENWEDAEEFTPYLYVDVGDQMAKWRELVASYEFVRGGISSFAYLDYYTSLATVRGAEARRRQAVAFDIDPLGKKRVLDSVP